MDSHRQKRASQAIHPTALPVKIGYRALFGWNKLSRPTLRGAGDLRQSWNCNVAAETHDHANVRTLSARTRPPHVRLGARDPTSGLAAALSEPRRGTPGRLLRGHRCRWEKAR